MSVKDSMEKNICGIYKITNLINNKIYIGSSICCASRKANHKRGVFDTRISRAIKKYGWDNFSFEIVEICNKEVLREIEKNWILKYNSIDPKIGYNITSNTTNPNEGVSPSLNTRKKMSQSKLNKYVGELNPMFGKKHSKESKEKISRTRILKQIPGPMLGKKHSEKSKIKMSQSSKNRIRKTKKIKQYNFEGNLLKIWDSAEEAAIGLFNNKKYKNNIRAACGGYYKTSLGFKWEYV